MRIYLVLLAFALLLRSAYSEQFFKAKTFENWDVLLSFDDGKIKECHTVAPPSESSADYSTSLLAISYVGNGMFSISLNLAEHVNMEEVEKVFICVGKMKHKLNLIGKYANTFNALQDKAIINDIFYENFLLDGKLNVEVYMKDGSKNVDKYFVSSLLNSMIYMAKNC